LFYDAVDYESTASLTILTRLVSHAFLGSGVSPTRSISDFQFGVNADSKAKDWKFLAEVEKRPFDKLRAGLRRWHKAEGPSQLRAANSNWQSLCSYQQGMVYYFSIQ
jgi:hypothetical protein